MKRLPVIAALIAFAMLLAPDLARATSYGRDATNPACAAMRNNVIGAPEPLSKTSGFRQVNFGGLATS